MKLEEGVSKTYSSNTVHSDGEENKPLQEFTCSMETQLSQCRLFCMGEGTWCG